MKLGLHIPTVSWGGGPAKLRATLASIAQATETAGFDTIDVADHLWQHPIMGGRLEPQLEAYATLGFLAAHTERMRLIWRAGHSLRRTPFLEAARGTATGPGPDQGFSSS